tara:strand:+ start:2625 stop:3071 length:447 start_codon:yes stop_codon:yes gene_type:complete
MKVKIMMMFFWVVLAIFVGLQAYIRLAPAPAGRWELDAVDKAPGDYPSEGGFMAVRDLDNDGSAFLQNFDTAMLELPRTERVETGSDQALYVTRSGFWGFPDYTSAAVTQVEGTDHSRAVISGRLRFGRSDLGVNRKRLQKVLAQAGV